MGLMQRDVNPTYMTRGARSYKSEKKTDVATDANAQDDYIWECAIANSIDAIRDLADKALADRCAGRTKKITL